MTSKAYVFIEGLESEPVICGVIWYDPENKIGRFRYGQSYLARKDAFALDPVHLPLTDELFETRANKGLFGVLTDAGADAWGRKLITQLRTTKPENELEFLIAGASMGVGAISFSLSQSKSKAKVSRNTLNDIDLLLAGKNAILNSENVSVEVKKAFQYGESMGGARPKTVLQHNEQAYLLKFNRPDDLYNVARVESATMAMLNDVDGVNVASTRLLTGEEDVLMSERFDRRGLDVSHHFISANSLLTEGNVSEAMLKTTYSYGALAEYLRKVSQRAEDATELYKRMVFNVFIGNTDDHGRNHALLWDLNFGGWKLSPAYDVLPINNARQHALGIGEYGREGSINNVLSQCRRFGVTPHKAKSLVKNIQELVAEWPAYFKNNGVADGDIERLKAVIPDTFRLNT
ncbi:serine/threonine-protein kinase HipA [Idiomarina loihiensis]|uniref:type II toxin-antitoxin system HipA family toxin n=1 Tax=Idiomarina TaxID=135575 RepID=UPI000D70E131|nr:MULTISPECIES: type II toxin-antitoxin system HipA family toxin [Idiomarina]PWW36913.1 serine/threonine-protein kinase HipA [Idiomarina loihiensis]TDP46721.1 serine/threonine-protein kinase HipA [Idiomarina loihiensis]TDS22992.1 serine/threonine-protein kinase HipA [Idiomarina sp. H2]